MTTSLVDMQLVGEEALHRKLNRLPEKVGRRVINGAMREGGRVIQKEQKRRAPVRKSTGILKRRGGGLLLTAPGYLKRNIVVRKLSRRPQHGNAADRYRVGPNSAAFYGHILENFMGRPFVRPAWQAKKAAAAKKIADSMKRKLAQEVKRG